MDSLLVSMFVIGNLVTEGWWPFLTLSNPTALKAVPAVPNKWTLRFARQIEGRSMKRQYSVTRIIVQVMVRSQGHISKINESFLCIRVSVWEPTISVSLYVGISGYITLRARLISKLITLTLSDSFDDSRSSLNFELSCHESCLVTCFNSDFILMFQYNLAARRGKKVKKRQSFVS